MIEILLVYALLTSAAFYLGSRAVITQSLWSRYPPWLARWADCAACSGTAYGFAVGSAALAVDAAPPGSLSEWWSPFVIALCSMVWTPIVAGFMQRGFEQLGSAIAEEKNDGEA